MIIDSRLSTRIAISPAELDADPKPLHELLITQLKDAASGMGASVERLNVEVFTSPDVRPDDPSLVYLCARFTGLNRAEVVGGTHDGAQVQVDKQAPYIRIHIDPTVDPRSTPLTDDNSRWYSRAGISDATGFWAYVPSDPPASNGVR